MVKHSTIRPAKKSLRKNAFFAIQASTSVATRRGGGMKGGCGAPYTRQRSLHCILAQDPTTAGSTQFCLLCCQPEPIPGPSTARMSQLTPCDPCRLPAWSGRAINMPCRTWNVPEHSNTKFPSGQQEIGYSQQTCTSLFV